MNNEPIQKKQGVKEIELSEGKIATVSAFKGRHIVEAQKVIGKESEKMMLALIAQCVTIDGNPVLLEELEDMDGADVLVLMGEFGGNF